MTRSALSSFLGVTDNEPIGSHSLVIRFTFYQAGHFCVLNPEEIRQLHSFTVMGGPCQAPTNDARYVDYANFLNCINTYSKVYSSCLI